MTSRANVLKLSQRNVSETVILMKKNYRFESIYSEKV